MKPFAFEKKTIFFISPMLKVLPLLAVPPIREILDKLQQPPCPCLNRLPSSTERVTPYLVIFYAEKDINSGDINFGFTDPIAKFANNRSLSKLELL